MPLTAEEKKRRKEEKKAQKQREAGELKIKRRKDELGREVRTTQANIATYMKKWYIQNYEARFPYIKEEMEVAWHLFEHTVDLKDFVISELLDRLDEVRLQQSISWQDYLLKMDDMINDFLIRLQNLDKEYQEDLQQLLNKAMYDKIHRENEQVSLEDYYKTILYIMEEKFSEETTQTQGEYITKRDEEAKKGSHNIEMMNAALEKSSQMTSNQIRGTLQEYKDTTETRRKELEALKDKDDYYMDMIRRQDSRMAKLFEEVSSLQSQLNVKHESKLQLEDLKRDREETYKEYKSVRGELSRDAEQDESRLLTLTTESNNILQDLENVLQKGEKILRLSALCRKLATQEEKVLPYGVKVNLSDDCTEGDNPFSLFWRKYANVNLTRRKLESTLDELKKENQELTDLLKTTFEIMAMTQVS